MGNVLFRVEGVKMYFPMKKTSMVQKQHQYIKANDRINLEIYEGETLGLVGESGCGKSTFGRVLLQLYQQTEGEVIYYGKSIKEMLPEYQLRIYRNLPRAVKRLRQLKNQEKSESEGREFLEEEKLLAKAIGGFLCSDDIDTVSKILVEQYENWKKQHRLRKQLDLVSKKEFRYHKQRKQMEELKSNLERLQREERILDQRLDELKQACQVKPEYNRYEAEYEPGVYLSQLTENELRSLRKDLQLVFQDPYSSLNPRMTVGQIIGEGVRTHQLLKNQQAIERYVTQIMEDCGLAAYMIHRYPHQFSGGQRQRIGIARSLALHPKFIVCDEAVSALDVSIQSQIINLLMDLKKKERLTYLFISHDLSVIRYVSDRIGVMYLGKVVELSRGKELFEHPLHPYTRVLLTAIPSVEGRVQPIIELLGELPNPMNPPKGCRFHTRCQYCTEICMKQEPAWEEVSEGHWVACHHVREITRNEHDAKRR